MSVIECVSCIYIEVYYLPLAGVLESVNTVFSTHVLNANNKVHCV